MTMPKDDDSVAAFDDTSVADDEAERQDADGTEANEQSTEPDYKALYEQTLTNFKGLQGAHQQLVESTRTQKVQDEEKQLRAKFEAELEGMTETEAQYARRAFDLELENRRLKASAESAAPISQELAKRAVFDHLVEQYGVSRKWLERKAEEFGGNPVAVAAAAKGAYEARLEQQKPKGNSQVEGSKTRGASDEAQLLQQANSGNWDAYWQYTDRQNARAARQSRY